MKKNKKLATLITLSTILSGCTSIDTDETAIFEPGEHLISNYKLIHFPNDLSGRIYIPDGYKYNNDLTCIHETYEHEYSEEEITINGQVVLAYTLSNDEEVEARAQKHEITGIKRYKKYGTPTNQDEKQESTDETTKVFDVNEHVLMVKKTPTFISDLIGQLIVPEGYQYNQDITYVNGDIVYTISNKEEVEVKGKKNSLTNVVEYDSYGTPVNKKEKENENEVEKVFEPGEHILFINKTINTTSDLENQIIIPDGYKYNDDITAIDGNILYSLTNDEEVIVEGKMNNLTGNLEYNGYGTPINQKSTSDESAPNKTFNPEEHVLIRDKKIRAQSDCNSQLYIPQGYKINKGITLMGNGEFIYTLSNKEEVVATGEQNSLTGNIEYRKAGTPVKEDSLATKNSTEKTFDVNEHVLLKYKNYTLYKDINDQMIIPDGYEYTNNLAILDSILIYVTQNDEVVKVTGEKNNLTGNITYKNYGIPITSKETEYAPSYQKVKNNKK